MSEDLIIRAIDELIKLVERQKSNKCTYKLYKVVKRATSDLGIKDRRVVLSSFHRLAKLMYIAFTNRSSWGTVTLLKADVDKLERLKRLVKR